MATAWGRGSAIRLTADPFWFLTMEVGGAGVAVVGFFVFVFVFVVGGEFDSGGGGGDGDGAADDAGLDFGGVFGLAVGAMGEGVFSMFRMVSLICG